MPLPNKLQRIIGKFAKRDRKIAKNLFPYLEKKGDLKLYILKTNGRDRKFDILGIVDDWGVEFNTYRDRTQFSVSTTREDFGLNSDETFYQAILKATHIAKGNGEIYRLDDGDGVQAFQFDWSYKVLATHQAQMSFTLADTEAEEIP